MELHECFNGVANVNIDLDDARIELNEEIYADGMLNEVGFCQPSEHGMARMTCGQDKLYLDSHAMNNRMFATKHFTNVEHRKKISSVRIATQVKDSQTLSAIGMYISIG